MMIELFLLFIFYQYQNIEKEHIRTNLFLEMKNYSLDFEDTRFDIDIIPQNKKQTLYELGKDDKSLFILVPFQDTSGDVLKIFYPLVEYKHLVNKVEKKQRVQFLFLTVIAILISILAALYSLRPIRSSLRLLEDFIKDIIHDLNTPLTSILINLKMIDGKSEEIESISRSAKNIAMLHENLDCYLKEVKSKEEQFSLKSVIEEQVKFFAPRYDYLVWKVDVGEYMLSTDKNAFTRIIYNLLSNACRYNTSNGYIDISLHNKMLTIENKSYGVKEPSKVFERFYKESERGLGIGLHIVEKLCTELKIRKSFTVQNNIVKVSLSLSEVTTK
jgi:two-component system OmpR family sensor kinase